MTSKDFVIYFKHEESKVHTRDNEDCKSCPKGFPTPCLCGGLIHAELVRRVCDKCGRSSELRTLTSIQEDDTK